MPVSSPCSFFLPRPNFACLTGCPRPAPSHLQHRPWILTAYGMWACWCVLGIPGTATIFLHTLISFCVAQFRSLFLSWLCSLFLLSTLRLQDVEEIKVSVSILPLGRRRSLWRWPLPGGYLCFQGTVNCRTAVGVLLVAVVGWCMRTLVLHSAVVYFVSVLTL